MFMDGPGGPHHPGGPRGPGGPGGPGNQQSEYINEISVAAINQMEQDYIKNKDALLQDLLDESDTSDKSPSGLSSSIKPSFGPPFNIDANIQSQLSIRSPRTPSVFSPGGNISGASSPRFFPSSPFPPSVHKRDVIFVPNSYASSHPTSSQSGGVDFLSIKNDKPTFIAPPVLCTINSVSSSSIISESKFIDSSSNNLHANSLSSTTADAVTAPGDRTGLLPAPGKGLIPGVGVTPAAGVEATTPVIEIISPVHEGRGLK